MNEKAKDKKINLQDSIEEDWRKSLTDENDNVIYTRRIERWQEYFEGIKKQNEYIQRRYLDCEEW